MRLRSRADWRQAAVWAPAAADGLATTRACAAAARKPAADSGGACTSTGASTGGDGMTSRVSGTGTLSDGTGVST